MVDFSKTRVEIKSYGGGFWIQKLCRLSFFIFYFRIIIIISLTLFFTLHFFLIFALLFSSLLSTPFIRFLVITGFYPLIRNEPLYKMPFADIGSLGLQETNGCVCYSMPFGFLEQGKTAVFVSDAILFVYLFFSGSLWIHWFSFLSGDGKCLAH